MIYVAAMWYTQTSAPAICSIVRVRDSRKPTGLLVFTTVDGIEGADSIARYEVPGRYGRAAAADAVYQKMPFLRSVRPRARVVVDSTLVS